MKYDAIGYIGSTYLLLLPNITMEGLSKILAMIAPLVIMMYHLAKLRKDVVNVDHDGSWRAFLKSWFSHKFKKKKDEQK